MRAGELARNRDDGDRDGARRARIDRDCAAERMTDDSGALMSGALEENQRRERIEHAFVEIIGGAIVDAGDADALARQFESEARV